MANGHLEDSLRREIESYLESRLSAVKQEITTLQSLLNESLSTFLDRQGDVQMEGSMLASITEHLHAAHERGVRVLPGQVDGGADELSDGDTRLQPHAGRREPPRPGKTR